jgi:hypothetical protein
MICLQHMEEQFAGMAERIGEQVHTQIETFANQFSTMGVINGCHCQPTLCYMDEDDVGTFSEVQSQWNKVRLDTRCLWYNTLTVIRKSQIHLPNPNPSYVEEEDEFFDEEFQEDEFIDEEFKH